MGIAGDLCLIVVAAFFGGLLAHRLGLPLLLGYIVAGVVVGPHTAGPTVLHVEDITTLADVGVALLLFTVGLEFSLRKLRPLIWITVLGTSLQMALTLVLGSVACYAFGIDWVASIWLGCLLSLSSTMVALSVLAEQGYLQALSGRVMLSMLVFQDLAVVPLMILLPSLKDLRGGLSTLAVALGSAILFVAFMLLVGAKVLPRLLHRITLWNSRELFFIAVVAIALGIGMATHALGLSFAFGAFLAGMVLAESDHSHEALTEIGPLRDLFTVVFFVSVGMLIEPPFLLAHLGILSVITLLVMTAKAGIFAGVTRLFGYRNIVPLATALSLCQVGEFSFVVARMGVTCGALDAHLYGGVLVVALLSMALTPALCRLNGPLYTRWRRRFPAPDVSIPREPVDMENHLVLVGYGGVGKLIARTLQAQNSTPILVIELEIQRVHEADAATMAVLQGDITDAATWDLARLEKARLIVLTTANSMTGEVAVDRLRSKFPTLPMVCLVSSLEERGLLAASGVEGGVIAEVETALELTRQAMNVLGLDDPTAAQLRTNLYRLTK